MSQPPSLPAPFSVAGATHIQVDVAHVGLHLFRDMLKCFYRVHVDAYPNRSSLRILPHKNKSCYTVLLFAFNFVICIFVTDWLIENNSYLFLILAFSSFAIELLIVMKVRSLERKPAIPAQHPRFVPQRALRFVPPMIAIRASACNWILGVCIKMFECNLSWFLKGFLLAVVRFAHGRAFRFGLGIHKVW